MCLVIITSVLGLNYIYMFTEGYSNGAEGGPTVFQVLQESKESAL